MDIEVAVSAAVSKQDLNHISLGSGIFPLL